ncbi:hypothetical protein VPH35_061744 [Triticum aestivum]
MASQRSYGSGAPWELRSSGSFGSLAPRHLCTTTTLLVPLIGHPSRRIFDFGTVWEWHLLPAPCALRYPCCFSLDDLDMRSFPDPDMSRSPATVTSPLSLVMNVALLMMAERPSRCSIPNIGRGCDRRKDHELLLSRPR